jgi:phage terminase small subunit
MGRPRKPVAVLKAQGTWHSTQQNRQDVEGTGEPMPPARMSPEARTLWTEIVPNLLEMEANRSQDSRHLAALCEAMAQHNYNARRMSKERSNDKLARLFWQSLAEVSRQMDRFGMSPRARAQLGLTIEPKKAPSPFDELKVVGE